MRPRFALHLAATLALAAGVCWGTLARSRGAGGPPTGADVKRMVAAGGACNLDHMNPAAKSAYDVPSARLFDALPDGAAFRPAGTRGMAVEPGAVAASFWDPDLRIYVGSRSALYFDGWRWYRADLAPADAERVRSALLAVVAAAQPPPPATPPGR